MIQRSEHSWVFLQEMAKLDRIFFSSATNDNYLLKAYVRAQMLASVLLRMQKENYVNVNIIALKLQT